jgi:hypothetical protein
MSEDIVTLWKYRDLPEALVARSKLESEDLPCFLADENIVRLNWFLSNVVGGLRLQVMSDDAQSAMELLGEEIPVNFTAEEAGEEYRQPECPRCHSRDVSFEPIYKGIALAVLWIMSLPVWLPKSSWKCEDCRHEWKAEYD